MQKFLRPFWGPKTRIYGHFEQKLSTKNLSEDDITKLMSLSGVKQYPMRVKCATLAWHTLTSAITNSQEEINTEKID